MPERIVQSPCRDTQLDQLTSALLRDAFECINTRGQFNLALSESSALDHFYTQLMCDPSMRAMPWQKMRVWFFGHANKEDSAQQAISIHSGILEENVFELTEDFVGDIDCCVGTTDLHELPVQLFGKCRSWLLLCLKDCHGLDTEDLGGVVHVYACSSR